jgi:hypothetical protein
MTITEAVNEIQQHMSQRQGAEDCMTRKQKWLVALNHALFAKLHIRE